MSFFVAKLRFSWYIGAKQIKETILVNKKEKAKAVIEILRQRYGDAACALHLSLIHIYEGH